MKNWKEGIQLAAFELKLSKRGFLMLPPYYCLHRI